MAVTANIGPREVQRRLLTGFAMLALGILIAVVLMLTGVHRVWRVALFLPFWMGALGMFQAREKT